MPFTDPRELRRTLIAQLPPEPPSPDAMDWIKAEYALAAAASAVANEPWGTTADDQEVTMPESTTIREAMHASAIADPSSVEAPIAPDPVQRPDLVETLRTPDGRAASAVAVEQASAQRKARGAGAGKPDPKPSAKPTRRTRQTTKAKPATTKQEPATPERPNAAVATRAATNRRSEKPAARAAATRRARSVAKLIEEKRIERNAITEAVAQHGDLARTAKDAGVDIARVEQLITPSSAPRTSTPRTSKIEYAKLLVAWLQAEGTPGKRFAATGADRRARHAVWLAGLMPNLKSQPKAEQTQAIRAEASQVTGKPWAQLAKDAPSIGRGK